MIMMILYFLTGGHIADNYDALLCPDRWSPSRHIIMMRHYALTGGDIADNYDASFCPDRWRPSRQL